MSATRRHFLQTTAAAGLSAVEGTAMNKPVSANDKIRVATIGFGIRGHGDTRTAAALPGNELVAVCDLYSGRRDRAKEIFGDQVFTTRDYRELLARKDIDAVVIATPDHWHSRIAVEAMEAGKDVYLEKPMVRRLEEGRAIVATQQKTGRVLQVGSQFLSSILQQKAKDLIKSGAIGELNLVEAYVDRNTARGATIYTIPPDASPDTVDWDRFLGSAPKRPFDAVRFFRWRNYWDYGTGVAGDLYVHLISTIHFVTGALGPQWIFSAGGLHYWKDGRDVPDVMLALCDYPKSDQHPNFHLTLRVNYKSSLPAGTLGFRYVGSEGIITVEDDLKISRPPAETEPGYNVESFSKAVQEKFIAEYRKEHPYRSPDAGALRPLADESYVLPAGYSVQNEHHNHFFSAVRTRKPVVEDAVFGFRAAAPAILANVSYLEHRACHWNPQAMTVES